MKKPAVLLLILCTVTLTYSNMGMGIDLRYNMNTYESKQEDTSDFFVDQTQTSIYNSFSLTPRLVIMSDEKIEFSPYFIFEFTSSKNITEIEDEDPDESKTTQFSLGAGLGVYFHLIRGNVIDLSIGPRIGYLYYFKPIYSSGFNDYDSYLNMNIGLAAPLNIDFHCNEKVHLRLSSEIIELSYTISKYKRYGRTQTNNGLNFYIVSYLLPSFGMIFLF